MCKRRFKDESLARKVFRVFNVLFLGLLVLAVLIPIVDILLGSMSENWWFDKSGIPSFIKTVKSDSRFFGFKVYEKVFEKQYFGQNLSVSVITTVSCALLGLFVSAVCAYISVQRDMPGAKLFWRFAVFAMIFDAGIIPQFLSMRKMGLLNTIVPVIIYDSFNFYCIVILRRFFADMPRSVFEAAELDGCTPVGMFFKLALPLARAPLTVAGLILASNAWNEYVKYCLFISDKSKYNLTTHAYWLALKQWNGVTHCFPDFDLPYGTEAFVWLALTVLPVLAAVSLVSKNFIPVFDMEYVKE